MRILVVNSGSSSIKYQLRVVEGGPHEHDVMAVGSIDRIGEEVSNVKHRDLVTGREVRREERVEDHAAALDLIANELSDEHGELAVDAVGHRVVHGGELFSEPVVINNAVTRAIERLNPLAPLHNPAHVLGIRTIAKRWHTLPQVAVFDTGFHATLPERAWRYAIPDELYPNFGIRRYGFHGTSYDYVTGKASEFLGIDRQDFNGVIAHLGNGASAAAIQNGISVDTSMGFTPLAGLVMGTRSGDVDPSVLVFLGRHGYDADQIDEILNRKSGLLALTGMNDMRAISDAAEAGDRHALLGLEITAYRLAKYIGGYHVAVGGMKALVFTAGIGEHDDGFRARVLEQLGALGITIDPETNAQRRDDIRVISGADSAIPVIVVPTDEEAAIAEATVRTLQAEQG